jgi:hypothetical protein
MLNFPRGRLKTCSIMYQIEGGHFVPLAKNMLRFLTWSVAILCIVSESRSQSKSMENPVSVFQFPQLPPPLKGFDSSMARLWPMSCFNSIRVIRNGALRRVDGQAMQIITSNARQSSSSSIIGLSSPPLSRRQWSRHIRTSSPKEVILSST